MFFFNAYDRIQTVSKAYRDFSIPSSAFSSSSSSSSFEKEFGRLHRWFAACQGTPSYAVTVVDNQRLIDNYIGYANNSATSDAATKFRDR